MGFLGWCLPLNSVSLLHLPPLEREGGSFSFIFYLFISFSLTWLTFGESNRSRGLTCPNWRGRAKEDDSSVRFSLFSFFFSFSFFVLFIYLFFKVVFCQTATVCLDQFNSDHDMVLKRNDPSQLVGIARLEIIVSDNLHQCLFEKLLYQHQQTTFSLSLWSSFYDYPSPNKNVKTPRSI